MVRLPHLQVPHLVLLRRGRRDLLLALPIADIFVIGRVAAHLRAGLLLVPGLVAVDG